MKQLEFDFSATATPSVAACAERATSRAAKPASPATRRVSDARRHRGQRNYLAGHAAEDSVARTYGRRGQNVVSRRYRGTYGEIDLVVRDGETLIFVEVKKGRSHDAALSRVSRAQFARIYAAATEFVEDEPKGQLTEMRFDVATVDQCGSVKLHPGILAHY